MGQRDDVFVSVVHVPEVRDKSENFGGDPVDWCQPIFPEPNDAENLDSVLLEDVELEHDARQSQSMHPILFVQPQPCLRSPRFYGIAFQPSDVTYFTTAETYFVSIATSCKIFLVARKCRNIEEPSAEVDMIVEVTTTRAADHIDGIGE